MDDLLRALMGAGGSQPQRNQGGDAADLLGALLGGGQAQQGQGADAGDLLGALLGGGQPQQGQGAGAGDLLGALLGGGQPAQPAAGGLEGLVQNPMVLQMLLPLIEPLAKKLKISPQIAMMIVTFVIQQLMANRGKSARGGKSGFNLNSLLTQAGSAQGLTPSHVQATGMPRELSRATGLDDDTATRGILEVLDLLGGHASQAGLHPAAPAKGGSAKVKARPNPRAKR